jgi:uncharacterized lipoprotein YbaY
MASDLLGVLMSAASLSVIVRGSMDTLNRLDAAQSRQIGRLTITGQLAYRERIALPTDIHAFATTWRCGAQDVSTGYSNQTMV